MGILFLEIIFLNESKFLKINTPRRIQNVALENLAAMDLMHHAWPKSRSSRSKDDAETRMPKNPVNAVKTFLDNIHRLAV